MLPKHLSTTHRHAAAKTGKRGGGGGGVGGREGGGGGGGERERVWRWGQYICVPGPLLDIQTF